MARERNAKAAGGVAKSQLKINEAAKDIQCDVCKATFLKTTREKAYENPRRGSGRSFQDLRLTRSRHRLTEHATNKHSKTLAECFPSFVPT
jgi:hypothetical protein